MHVDEINEKIMEKNPNPERIYLSADSIAENLDVNPNAYPVEFLNSINENGLPPHRLVLKVGIPVTIQRNLDAKNGSCDYLIN
jgi:hypothetical protein